MHDAGQGEAAQHAERDDAFTPGRSQPRSGRAGRTVVGPRAVAWLAAGALHAFALALLCAMPVRAPAIASASRVIRLDWIAPPPPRAPAIDLAPPRASSAAEHRAQRATTTRAASPPLRAAPSAEAAAPALTPPSAPADLFPSALLQELATHGARPPSPAAGPGDRDTPAGWLDDAAAGARTRSGQVDHVWRQIERELVQSFKPPIAAVHDDPRRGIDRFGNRLRSLFGQSAAMVARGDEGLRHPVEPGSHAIGFGPGGSIDLSKQGFPGIPEGINLRAMPLAQQQASAAATNDPERWLTVEIEISVDGEGRVSGARVVVPSGRRAFDRYALAAVRNRVAGAAPPSTLSRWICRAGYAVSRIDSVQLKFDVMMLFDKKMRDQLALQYAGKQRVETDVSLAWVKNIK